MRDKHRHNHDKTPIPLGIQEARRAGSGSRDRPPRHQRIIQGDHHHHNSSLNGQTHDHLHHIPGVHHLATMIHTMEAEIHPPPPTTNTIGNIKGLAVEVLLHLGAGTINNLRLPVEDRTEGQYLETAQVILKIPMATIPIIEVAGRLLPREEECRWVADEITEANILEEQVTVAAGTVVLPVVDRVVLVLSTQGNTVDSRTTVPAAQAAAIGGTRRHHPITAVNTLKGVEDHHLLPAIMDHHPLPRGGYGNPILGAAVALAAATIHPPIDMEIQMHTVHLRSTIGAVNPPPTHHNIHRPGEGHLLAIPNTTGTIRSNNSSSNTKRAVVVAVAEDPRER